MGVGAELCDTVDSTRGGCGVAHVRLHAEAVLGAEGGRVVLLGLGLRFAQQSGPQNSTLSQLT